MTGISMDFQSSPRYQRAVQKMAAMSPGEKRVLNTAMMDKKFAGADLDRKMYLASLGAEKLQQERTRQSVGEGLRLGRKTYKDRKRAAKKQAYMARKRRKRGEGQQNIASAIGLGNLATSMYYGGKAGKAGQTAQPKAGLGNYFYKRQYAH